MSAKSSQELVLNDSVIQRIDISGTEVSIIFSIAHIHFFNAEGEWLPGKTVFKRARLCLENVSGRVPCEGTIFDGNFVLNNEKFLNIPLPGPHEGDLELHLIMDCGEFSFTFKKIRLTLLGSTKD